MFSKIRCNQKPYQSGPWWRHTVEADRNDARLPAWLDHQPAFIFPGDFVLSGIENSRVNAAGLGADLNTDVVNILQTHQHLFHNKLEQKSNCPLPVSLYLISSRLFRISNVLTWYLYFYTSVTCEDFMCSLHVNRWVFKRCHIFFYLWTEPGCLLSPVLILN